MRVISALIRQRFFLSLCCCFRFWFSFSVQILACTLFLLLRLWFLKWRSPCVLLPSVFPFVPWCFFFLISVFCFCGSRFCVSILLFVLCNLSLQSFPPLCFFSLVQLMLVHWLAVLLFVSFLFSLFPPCFFLVFLSALFPLCFLTLPPAPPCSPCFPLRSPSCYFFFPFLSPLCSSLTLRPPFPFIAKTTCVFYNENVQDHYCSANGSGETFP